MATIAALSALLLVASGCASAEDPGMSAPTAASSSPADADATVLVVVAGPSGGAMMEAIIAGRLRVEDGCYFVGDVLLIAPTGSRASADGTGIEIAGRGRISIGDELRGGGGHIDQSPPPDGVTPADVPCVADADRYALLNAEPGAD